MQLDANGEVDLCNFREMVDRYLAAGFNYFDTAHVYYEGKSEIALREGLTSRYPRERYVLTNKLTSSCFEKEEDILPLFESAKQSGFRYIGASLSSYSEVRTTSPLVP